MATKFSLFTFVAIFIYSATSSSKLDSPDTIQPATWTPISKVGYGLVSKPQARIIVSSPTGKQTYDGVKTPVAIPKKTSPLDTFGACVTSGESGICTPPGLCNLYRGSLGSSCNKFGGVCCINTVSTCGQVATKNNTYWQSPPSTEISECSLNIKLDTNLVEQKKPICQIRLDFLQFSIAQPNLDSVCNSDNFTVFGADNKIPVICGDNNGQHMYLNVPASSAVANELQLVFNLGDADNFTRQWKMKIAFLPCGADYLAPDNCLQYLTARNGTVSSFNFKNVVPRTNHVRQLANQDYNICFREELIDGQVARSTCITPCPTNNPSAKWFNIIGNAITSTGMLISCSADYIKFASPFIELVSDRALLISQGRFCGTITRQHFYKNFQALCTSEKPFQLHYFTDEDESGDVGNTGLCFTFTQRVSVAQHALGVV